MNKQPLSHREWMKQLEARSMRILTRATRKAIANLGIPKLKPRAVKPYRKAVRDE